VTNPSAYRNPSFAYRRGALWIHYGYKQTDDGQHTAVQSSADPMECVLMNYSEAISKRVLEAILPNVTMEYRLAQSNGEYDFDLLHSDGTIAAVEVTASVVQTIAAIRSNRRGGSVLKAAICRKSWLIFPTKGASIDTIRRDADSQLVKLEQEGIKSFFCVNNEQFPIHSRRLLPTEHNGGRRCSFRHGADDTNRLPGWRRCSGCKYCH